VVLPPSPGVAGVYASVDAVRGVWKAPANIGLQDVIAPTLQISDDLQGNMNIDATSGKSVNAIRAFTGKGVLVWGARTLDGNSNDFKYISVRRLFIMVEESARKAAIVFVFEPNDGNTWVKVRAMIENFLTNLWRLAHWRFKTEQAFYVKVGLGQTMTFDDILNGRMIVEIGMAPVRPAEFIILRFSQIQQQA
jgi:phage tail sheath protein FI